jgi:hypothetical protein
MESRGFYRRVNVIHTATPGLRYATVEIGGARTYRSSAALIVALASTSSPSASGR